MFKQTTIKVVYQSMTIIIFPLGYCPILLYIYKTAIIFKGHIIICGPTTFMDIVNFELMEQFSDVNGYYVTWFLRLWTFVIALNNI